MHLRSEGFMKSTPSRRQAIPAVMASWPFLASLALLLLNDGWLKAAHGGIVTGKLSDFAGLAVVGLLLHAVWPRQAMRVDVGLALAFAWWKCPASQAFIDGFNALGWVRIGRVVDYSDLLALAVLPVCRAVARRADAYILPWPPVPRRMLAWPAGALTLLALMGTSVLPLRQQYDVRGNAPGYEFPREAVAAAIMAVAGRHGLKCLQCSQPTESATLSGDYITLIYVFVGPGAVSFTVLTTSKPDFFNATSQAKANALREDLKGEFARRFAGLEYVEPLETLSR
jgi:hypothetical protein